MQQRTVRVHHDETAGGPIDLALFEVGTGGRPLLLVHGFTGAKEDFADHAAQLAERGWWVVAPDLRGHGSSTKPDDEAHYSLDHFADDLAALIADLAWERHVLLGHSMGGMIAQVVATRAPDRLDGLILMDTSHESVQIDNRELAEMGVMLVREGGMEAIKAVLDQIEDDPLGSEAYDRVIRERPGFQEFADRKFLSSSPAMYASMLLALLDQEDRLEALASLDLPTLVLVGDQDRPFLGPSAWMAEAIAGAHHAVIPDAGHSPQFENPDAWFETIVSFLDQL